MEDNELKAIQEAITRQATNNYPQIYIQDLQSGRVFEYGKNCHDRLVISEDGRSLHYENLQNGDGSCCGDYRFYYEKPKIETEMDKMHEWDLDRWARNVKNKSISELEEDRDNALNQRAELELKIKSQNELIMDLEAIRAEKNNPFKPRFYIDDNCADGFKYVFCARPYNHNMSLHCFMKNGCICGYASEHYDTWNEDKKPIKEINFNQYASEFISPLIQENQALKDRWQKLKEFIETSNEVLLYSIEDKPAKLGNKKYNYFERKQLLDKMQELEKEIK